MLGRRGGVAELCRHAGEAVMRRRVAGREFQGAAIGVAGVGETLGIAEQISLRQVQGQRIREASERGVEIGSEGFALAQRPEQAREVFMSGQMQRIARHGLAIERNRLVELTLELQRIGMRRHHVGAAGAQRGGALAQGQRLGDEAALGQIDAEIV